MARDGLSAFGVSREARRWALPLDAIEDAQQVVVVAVQGQQRASQFLGFLLFAFFVQED